MPATPLARSDPRLDRDAAQLHRALSGLLRVFQFRDRDRICCHDISVTQCWALEALVRAGPLTLNQLAGELYLDKSTASRVVRTLERKGYLSRAPHPLDGRAVQLRLTPAGRGLHERIEAEILAGERRLLAEFDHEVREAMTQLIAQLAQAAAARVVARGGVCCAVEKLPDQSTRKCECS